MTRGLDAIKKMGNQAPKPQQATIEVLPAADRPVTPPAEAPEKRHGWGTRIRPSLHIALRQFTIGLQAKLGRRVIIEDVLDALLVELESDPELQARVAERCRK